MLEGRTPGFDANADAARLDGLDSKLVGQFRPLRAGGGVFVIGQFDRASAPRGQRTATELPAMLSAKVLRGSPEEGTSAGQVVLAALRLAPARHPPGQAHGSLQLFDGLEGKAP